MLGEMPSARGAEATAAAAAAAEGGAGGSTGTLGLQLVAARAQADALARRLAEAEGRAAAEEKSSREKAEQLRREAAEASGLRAQYEEKLEEAERLSTQRAAAAAAERREVSTLKAQLEALSAKHEAMRSTLTDELTTLKTLATPMAESAKQVPILMEALEACERERKFAMVEARRAFDAVGVALAKEVRSLDDEVAATRAAADAAAAEAEEQRKAQLAELRKEHAVSKKKATALLLERETELTKLHALAKAQQQQQAALAAAPDATSSLKLAAALEQAAVLKAAVGRLERERHEWQVRNLELHQLLRSASLSEGGGGGGGGGGGAPDRTSKLAAAKESMAAATTLLEVAKQQAQRDEELMGARIQVVELQAQLVEARDLHGALRAKLAETERSLKRTEHGGADATSTEYMKNIILQLYMLEGGMEKLLPIIATFLQFSPQELARIREVRATFTDGGGGGGGGGKKDKGGGGLFGSLGEDWLFGADPTAEAAKRKGVAQARSGGARGGAAPRSAEEAEGGAWSELERSWKKTQQLKQLLAAANAHLEKGQAQLSEKERLVAALRVRIKELGGAAEDIVVAQAEAGEEANGASAAPPPQPPSSFTSNALTATAASIAASMAASMVASVREDTAVKPEAADGWSAFAEFGSTMPPTCSKVAPAQGSAPTAAPTQGSAPTAAQISNGAAARRAPSRKGASPAEQSDAEREAERALERELEADAEARVALQRAVKAREPVAVRAALDVMAERGLDSDDSLVEEAKRMLTEMRGASGKKR